MIFINIMIVKFFSKNNNFIIKIKYRLFILIFFFSFYLFKKEINDLEKYFKLCDNKLLLKKKIFKKTIRPAISIISPIYNKEKYILRFLRSIQNQNFVNIEIIFVDDCSKDNSTKIIENYQKEDERILLIKNKKNKGTFISRNEGALKSKGEYLIFADSDDLLINNILRYSYKIAKNGNYDIVRYNGYIGNGNIILYNIIKNIQNNQVYQPELSLYIYYGIGNFTQNDFFIWNKIIKRNIFISSLNEIDKYYLNQFMIDCEDGLMNLILHKKANSFYYTKKIGYYYIKNEQSITIYSNNNLIKRLKSNFLYFKFIFQYTKNNKIEKTIAENIFLSVYYYIYKKKMIHCLKFLIKKNKIYKDVIHMYLNSKFISLKTKKIFKKFQLLL